MLAGPEAISNERFGRRQTRKMPVHVKLHALCSRQIESLLDCAGGIGMFANNVDSASNEPQNRRPRSGTHRRACQIDIVRKVVGRAVQRNQARQRPPDESEHCPAPGFRRVGSCEDCAPMRRCKPGRSCCRRPGLAAASPRVLSRSLRVTPQVPPAPAWHV